MPSGRTRVASSCLTLLLLAACSGGDAPTEPVVQPDPPGTVGATGGTVSATGGGASVSIPSGALGTKTQITVNPMPAPPADPNLLGGTAYSFGPSGTQFSAPVQMTLRYDAAAVPDGLPESALYIAKNMSGKWERISGAFTLDANAKTVTGQVTSFSDYAVLADACAARPVSATQATSVNGTLRTGDCVFAAGTETPQLEDFFVLTTTQTAAYHLAVTTSGFRPTMGVKAATAHPDSGTVYAFRGAAAGATESKVEVILAPGTYHIWAGNRDGLGEGTYKLDVTPVSGDNRSGCRAYFIRPPLDMSQAIDGATDCIQQIAVSPDPAFIGQTIAEEYYYVKVLPGQTLRVTTSPVSGEAGFAPFPTIFLPNGAVQDAGAGPTRTVSFTAPAAIQGYVLVGVSSVFTKHPSEGGRYTQGTYRLQVSLQ